MNGGLLNLGMSQPWPKNPQSLSALMVDLGGHTADNHPALLSHRLASVQATYLGFYGPSYSRCCDWWIVDHVLERFLSQSYPGAEKLWALPGPSLCYIPSLHGLPSVDRINYQEPNHLVFGSFNHTRKLTHSSLQRFGKVLKENPDAVLQFAAIPSLIGGASTFFNASAGHGHCCSSNAAFAVCTFLGSCYV